MDTLDILTQTRALISDPQRWSQKGTRAGRNKQDKWVPHHSSDACAWDLLGALQKVQRGDYNGEAYDILSALCIKRGYEQGNVGGFNSNSTHHEIMSLLSEAIADTLNEQGNK